MLWSLSFSFDDWLGKWCTAHDNLPTGQDPVMNIHERTNCRDLLFTMNWLNLNLHPFLFFLLNLTFSHTRNGFSEMPFRVNLKKMVLSWRCEGCSITKLFLKPLCLPVQSQLGAFIGVMLKNLSKSNLNNSTTLVIELYSCFRLCEQTGFLFLWFDNVLEESEKTTTWKC